MQVRALSGGVKLHMPSDEAIENVKNQVAGFGLDLANLSWQPLLRMLDKEDASYRN